MAKQDRWQNQLWQSDDEFELLLQQSLSAIQPPADFSNRVMAAIRQENAAKTAAAAEIIPFAAPQKATKTKKQRFGLSYWAGLGTIAASLVLFWMVSGWPGADNSDIPGIQTQPQKVLQVAAELEPLTKLPPKSQNTSTEIAMSGNQSEPAAPVQNDDNNSGEFLEPNNENTPQNVTEPDNATEPIIDESGSGELILPRAAFGTEAQGTLAVRLLAEVENNQIYNPTINRRGSVATFYTADEDNVYTWRVNLSTADSPEVSIVTSRTSIDDIGSMLSKTTGPCDATTLVTSPDNTIIAQNSPDGLWISLAEGEVYSLSEETGGSLLAWSPDSSKLLFTNEQGQLFIGYPLEKRIYQVTDMSVEDVCWSTDNQTIVFLVTNNGQSALYVAELI